MPHSARASDESILTDLTDQIAPNELAEAIEARGERLSLFALIWGLPAILWQCIFFVLPLGFLVAMTFWSVSNFRVRPDFTLINWFKVLGAGYFYAAYGRTFVLAIVATMLATLVAFPCAFALAFKASPSMRRLAVFLLITPFFTSYLVRVYSWQILLADRGIINGLLAAIGLGPIAMLHTVFGTMIGYLTFSLPLVVLLQLASLANIDRDLIEAAQNLGAGRLRTLWRVILPSARVGLIVGAAFAFLLAFGDFVSPAFLGGGKWPTLSILLVDLVKSASDWPRASVVALVMVASLLAVLLAALAAAYQTTGPSDRG
jgi:ABC-type spermidine/putrescine transport system permease subunit I